MAITARRITPIAVATYHAPSTPTLTVSGGGVAGGSALLALYVPPRIPVSGGAVAGGSAQLVLHDIWLPSGGAVAGGSVPILLRVPLPVAGGAVAGGLSVVRKAIRLFAGGGGIAGGAAWFGTRQPRFFCWAGPCGIGASSAAIALLQLSASSSAATSAPLSVGGGGVSSAVSAPLRLADGGIAASSAPLSLDGQHYSAALSQAHPLTAIGGSAALSAPLALSAPAVLAAPYSAIISADGSDITRQIAECTITSSEAALFDTISLSLPDGSRWPLAAPPSEIVISLPGSTQRFMVEEFTGDGPARTIWGRTEAAVYAEPWHGVEVWNERTSAAATAAELAYEIATGIWDMDDFPLPPRWEISGTPADALAELARAAGGVLVGDDGFLTVRRRWPTRPVDMSAAAVTISRETALDISIIRDETPSYGQVTVQGWSPEIKLPKFEVEGSPVLGQPAYLRLYWPGEDHPDISNWITSGSARLVSVADETMTETVVFTNGAGSVSYPIWYLNEFEWLGKEYGDLVWLENGYSTELELSSPGHGVATVTYTTRHERWLLSGQAAETVLFGVDVADGAIAADVRLESGGAVAGEVKQALLGSVAACVVHGSALLDDSRVRYTVRATLPRTGQIQTGATAWVEDKLTGLAGFGKVRSVETRITPSRITQNVEVALC